MEIPKGYRIANQLLIPDKEVEFFESLKDIWESADEQIDELTHRREEAFAILKGSLLRMYWEAGKEHSNNSQILFDKDRKAIIEVVADDTAEGGTVN